MKILFICHANICRSFIAQEILKKKLPQAEVFSRGIYVDSSIPVPPKITRFLSAQNIAAPNHKPTQLSEVDLREATLIFCMESSHLERLLDRYAQYTDKFWLLNDFAWGKKTSIEDPIAFNGKAFEKQLLRLVQAVEVCADRLMKEFPQQLQNLYNTTNTL